MSSTVGVNSLSVVHKSSMGTTIAFPDVCKTPTPGGPVPIPYPNIALSSDTAIGTKKIKVDGNSICTKDSNFKMSTGDEAGSAGGGVVSSRIKGKAEFLTWSMNVKFEGEPAVRFADLMHHNQKNTPPTPVLQPPVIAIGMPPKHDCLFCGKTIP